MDFRDFGGRCREIGDFRDPSKGSRVSWDVGRRPVRGVPLIAASLRHP